MVLLAVMLAAGVTTFWLKSYLSSAGAAAADGAASACAGVLRQPDHSIGRSFS